MDFLEIDFLLFLYVAMKLIDFGVHALIAWGGSSGILSDNVSHGLLNVLR
jgi:hypothetical protein